MFFFIAVCMSEYSREMWAELIKCEFKHRVINSEGLFVYYKFIYLSINR